MGLMESEKLQYYEKQKTPSSSWEEGVFCCNGVPIFHILEYCTQKVKKNCPF